MRYIIKNYKNTDKTILIVTHMHICLDILNIVNSKIENKINSIDLLFYERGKLTKIFEIRCFLAFYSNLISSLILYIKKKRIILIRNKSAAFVFKRWSI